VIVTPHAGEFARLRSALGLGEQVPDAGAAVLETARALGQVVLRKGAETLIASPEGRLLSVRSATPWLATAGAGDVLAGALGAVIAHAGDAGDLASLAATAAWLHGRAARIAAHADAGPGRPIVALDVADALPAAVAEAIAGV
jgi:NAD(P)H-hydrate repair Nnr-like enzyme with NAD(P)H-hydrate dehydratase domain